jgi:hypothetical protein
MFDILLDKLNENTQGVTFGGNCWFKFEYNSDKFTIVSLNDDALDYTKTEYVPLVDIQDIEVPFVEKNKRSDYEREFYVAIKIDREQDEFNNRKIEFTESNPTFQALLETVNSLKETLSYTETVEQDGVDVDYKLTFKVKQPQKRGIFKWSNYYYQIISINFNATKMEGGGFFGNETKLYFGLKSDTSFGQTDDYELDTMEYSEIIGKTKRANSNINDTEETYSISKRTWTPTLTINFNGNTADLLLYKELTAQADLQVEYQLTVTNSALNTASGEDLDYTYDVIVTSINSTRKNNVVDTITFQLDRV